MIIETCEIDNYLLEYDDTDNEITFSKKENGAIKQICFIYVRNKTEHYKFLIDNNEYIKHFGDIVIILINNVLTIKMIGDDGENILKITDVYSFKEFLSKCIKYNSKYLRKSKITKIINNE